jgi:hypothetical protein
MNKKDQNTQPAAKPPTGRLTLGGAIFISGFLSPLLTPLVFASALPGGWKAAISGLLVFGIPELFMIIAVAVLGKEGYSYLKAKLFGILKKVAPSDEVGIVRYRFGLVLFTIPLLIGWLLPYFNHLLPEFESYKQVINVGGDLMFISSFFILGGDFWDKLRGLFVHRARITLNNQTPKNE